ncbi:hypothetical protein STSP2_00333 [Anaerohalosphaera lusitana]|uniref:Uncharacterized protein n=1 Tax=Anaerohalosphaera lusitana TaxID=1936003 RepID=A0A1U9NHW1_9BACT|nr:DUF6498-containing protein [Anaerohalosphaera lusitana]AQT67190.1 hypothetical protein STSP2_00333 [Anaerohalosphaera lusitana]
MSRFIETAAALFRLDPDELRSSRISIIVLIFANLVPLYGLFFLGWQAINILLIYWLEAFIVGFYNLLKLTTARCDDSTEHLRKLLDVPAFAMHFSIYCAVVGFIVFKEFSGYQPPPPENLDVPTYFSLVGIGNDFWTHIKSLFTPGIAVAAVIMFISHGVSFTQQLADRPLYSGRSLTALTFKPYLRVVPIHIVAAAGVAITQATGSTAAIILTLVLAKTAIDLAFFTIEKSNS